MSETNKYAAHYVEQKRRSGKMRRKSRDLLWKEPTNSGEIKVVLGIVIFQGIAQKSNLDYYHSTNPLIHAPIFGKTISRDRLKLVLKYLHFSNSEGNNDPLYKIRTLLNLFVARFKSNYIPERNIGIDESLVLLKGRLRWKRFIPLKRARFGIEAFILMETKTGYVLNIGIFTGKETIYTYAENLTKPSQIVLFLAEELLNKGYSIGMDNYYASSELFDILIANKTDAVGTVRYNRQNLSTTVLKAKLRKGQTIAQYKGKLLHLKWKDKKDMNMLSTIHNEEMQKITVAGKKCLKPSICIEYNIFQTD